MDHTTQTFLPPNDDNDPTYPGVPSAGRSVKSHASTKSTTRSLAESTTQSSGTASSAPTGVKAALTRVAPDGERCLITRTKGQLECTHLVARSTHIIVRKALEAAWGMESGKLDLDAVQNIFWSRSDIHRAFNDYEWLLLPTEKDLQAAIDFSNRRASQHTHSHFGTVYSNKTWKYHFLSLGYEETIFRKGNVPQSYTVHDSPYSDLGPVDSHLSPFYVIYNVGQKVHDIKDPNYEGHCKLPEDLSCRPLLDECEAVYLLWVDRALEELEAELEQSPSERSRYQAPSESESRSQNQNRTYRLRDRNWDKDPQARNSPQSGSGAGAPQRRNCTGTTQTTDQYLPTLEQSIHSTDFRLEAVSGTHEPSRQWANVGDWVASVKSCASNLGPQSDWEGAEQARRFLVKYRHEAAREPPRGSWEEWIPEYEFE
ncbi:hypothetical protein RSOLAG22IIIB_04571 [Rhizoctonia solani]|uniref:HNH nuclease domain-containing protein n=1 Tax=Rhizoctonia solani TaxID=456999 RepID=A0A0K6FYN7_9AGAM|nr:hypothetical protein RSOLAG22IIIB_04571 [Rhizoctonia solani]